ncbi:orotate phosphoribosyltransferase, partial [Brucella melitensis]|nr:orotate phosphoribosyltransferase [Brucella melitensis]
REAGCDVLGVVSIFTYELPKGKELLADAKIESHSLTDYTALLEVAQQKGYIKESDIASLQAWKENPGEWDK